MNRFNRKVLTRSALVLLAASALGACSKPDANAEAYGVPFEAGADEAANPTVISDPGSATPNFSASELMPLAVGNTWTYQVRGIGPDPYCTQAVTEQVVKAESRGDCNGFIVTWFCGTSELSSTWLGDVDGDLKEGTIDGDDLATRLASPPREGALWLTPDGTSTWHFHGVWSGPAGDFNDCWELREGDPENGPREVYCRGIGAVNIRNDTSGATLLSASLHH